MNETQKRSVKKWVKILLIAAASIALIAGMLMNVTICMAIVGLISLGALGIMIMYVIVERVYIWRVMGVLTPEEWDTVKWFDYSLISKGAKWVAEELREDGQEENAMLFDRIEKEVKRPKLLS